MKYSDDNLLLESLKDSGLSTSEYITLEEKHREERINKFIDLSKLRVMAYGRLFEGMVDSSVSYGDEAFQHFLNLSLEGSFVLFTETGKTVLEIRSWDDVKAIVSEIPSGLNVYASDSKNSFLIALTEEDNILTCGEIHLNLDEH